MLLVHVSDLHFREGQIGSPMDPFQHLRNEMLRDAREMCKRIDEIPAAILVSGDLAHGGKPSEFEFGQRWLRELCEACGTSESSLFVVPGNHDVDRSITVRAGVRAFHDQIKGAVETTVRPVIAGLLHDEDAGPQLYKSIWAYNDAAVRYFCSLRPPDRTTVVRDLPLNDGSTLRMHGLNSTFVSSEADTERELFVDPSAFQITRHPGVENLVVCHHPYEWLREGDALQDHLNDVARLQLFGHRHKSRIDQNSDYVRLSASAVQPGTEEGSGERGYNLIQLAVGGGEGRSLDVKVFVREWQERPGGFRAKTDRRGREYFDWTIRLDSWNAPERATPVMEGRAVRDRSQARHVDEDSKMTSLRETAIRFFTLSLNQRLAIAGKLNLLEAEDADQPDFERFRRVLLRARERELTEQLASEVACVQEGNQVVENREAMG